MIMNKKQIVIMAGLGLICFASFFTVGLFTRTTEAPTNEDGTPNVAQVIDPLTGDTGTVEADTAVNSEIFDNFQPQQADLKRSLTLKQLNSLIFEMRTKISEFTFKEKMLDEKEGRVQMSIDELQNNIKDMEDLHIKLAASLSAIKQQQKLLDERLIRIENVEKKNLVKTSAIYDKMKPAEASEILINLSKSNQIDYAVKITYYMSERTSANLLAEISKKKPELAAQMSDKLRWIEEAKQ
jgi:flagellar motility protein MotE (MotC chaperone)